MSRTQRRRGNEPIFSLTYPLRVMGRIRVALPHARSALYLSSFFLMLGCRGAQADPITSGVQRLSSHDGRSPDPRRRSQPILGLSHVMVEVDSQTWQAIVTAPVVRHLLSPVEVRTTTREGGRSYGGAYMYGRETYLEIQSSSPSGPPVGLGQLYLGTDVRGDIHGAIDQVLLATPGSPVRMAFATRRRGNEDLPWFYSALIWPPAYAARGAPASEDALFRLFLLEWHPQYLSGWTSDPSTDTNDVSRAGHLRSQWDSTAYLRDIIGITFALDSSERAALATRLRALRYSVRADAGRLEATGGGLTVVAIPVTGRHGVVALRLALQRPVTGQRRYAIGPRSELTFGDGPDAIWTFGP